VASFPEALPLTHMRWRFLLWRQKLILILRRLPAALTINRVHLHSM
jgi:hypothetical protein